MQFLELPAVFLPLAIAACGGGAKSSPAAATAPANGDVAKQSEPGMQHFSAGTCGMSKS